ncbi:unnamed protein product [Dracunculus medinensis]|uniref:6-phosphogluconolactonase n=1 Tax=Dracunculus medinensis TaxID=318479 RepID=A0A0N4UDM9_DRAME|nr:unnamed protein product [Dracunculus medinensis]
MRMKGLKQFRRSGLLLFTSFYDFFSGGSMPKLVAPILANFDSVILSKTRFFVVDERMVPLTDQESNTGSYMRLLQQITPSFPQYYPIDNTNECAKNYEIALRDMKPTIKDGWPVFDLLLLGIGLDGHTCSLFPGHPILGVILGWVAAIENSPKPPPNRITLTLPVLNHARNVCFIVTGKEKTNILKVCSKYSFSYNTLFAIFFGLVRFIDY